MSLSALLYRVITTEAYYLRTIYSNNLLQKSPGCTTHQHFPSLASSSGLLPPQLAWAAVRFQKGKATWGAERDRAFFLQDAPGTRVATYPSSMVVENHGSPCYPSRQFLTGLASLLDLTQVLQGVPISTEEEAVKLAPPQAGFTCAVMSLLHFKPLNHHTGQLASHLPLRTDYDYTGYASTEDGVKKQLPGGSIVRFYFPFLHINRTAARHTIYNQNNTVERDTILPDAQLKRMQAFLKYITINWETDAIISGSEQTKKPAKETMKTNMHMFLSTSDGRKELTSTATVSVVNHFHLQQAFRSKKKQMGVKPVVRREPHLQSVSQDKQQSSELLWKVSFCALEDENHGTGVFHKTTASRNCQQKENCNATGSRGNAKGLQELHLP
ncbi:hypothetical protein Anapl_00175 [Anas platyrhynchos]|uniref:Uncharacterized protein n=1 Tax=Anas platyrhynchos TaxID=8839 RepID=R0LQV8_ANAPL|nr:hypothetical protein Anapl_00175 [Anas platyrhynchos]